MLYLNNLYTTLDAFQSLVRSQGDASSSKRSEDPQVNESTFENVAIAVMGATGSGKTSFINMASGSDLRIGKGLDSCTSEVQFSDSFRIGNQIVTLIDTPGFDDSSRSDADILNMIAAFLSTSYEKGKKLSGVLYFHRISDFKVGGISTRNFKMFRELCGDKTLTNVVIVTNMWGEVTRDIGNRREAELKNKETFFKPVLDKGARMMRHTNNRTSSHNIIKSVIENCPLSLQIQREIVDEKKIVSQTAAGEELSRELIEQERKHKKEMEQIQVEMQEAIRSKDEETRRELEIETQKLMDQINKVQEEGQQLASNHNEEKYEMQKKFEEMVQNANDDREGLRRQVEELQEKLRSANLDRQQREDIQRRIKDLENRACIVV